MKKEIILSIILSLLVFIILFLVGILSIQNTQEQFFMFCASKNWEGTHELKGDFSGEMDCEDLWNTQMANGKWSKICSTFPFSSKPSCHTLCNLDCEAFNKKNSGRGCVC